MYGESVLPKDRRARIDQELRVRRPRIHVVRRQLGRQPVPPGVEHRRRAAARPACVGVGPVRRHAPARGDDAAHAARWLAPRPAVVDPRHRRADPHPWCGDARRAAHSPPDRGRRARGRERPAVRGAAFGGADVAAQPARRGVPRDRRTRVRGAIRRGRRRYRHRRRLVRRRAARQRQHLVGRRRRVGPGPRGGDDDGVPPVRGSRVRHRRTPAGG